MFVWHHHSLPITQYFSHYLWTLFLSPVQLFLFSFFFFFFQVLTESNEKKYKKKVKRWSKVATIGPLCVFNYNIAIELWVMETENSQKLFSVSITYNSKIRELSNGNRVIVYQTTFLSWVSPFLSYELWVMETENWVTKTGKPNTSIAVIARW